MQILSLDQVKPLTFSFLSPLLFLSLLSLADSPLFALHARRHLSAARACLAAPLPRPRCLAASLPPRCRQASPLTPPLERTRRPAALRSDDEHAANDRSLATRRDAAVAPNKPGHQCRAPLAPKPPPSHPLVALNGQNTPPCAPSSSSPLRPSAPFPPPPSSKPPPHRPTGAARPGLVPPPSPWSRRRGTELPPAACSRGAPPPPLLNPIRAHNPLPHLPPKPPSPDAPSLRRRRAAAAAQTHRRRPLSRRRHHRPSRPNPRPPLGSRRRPLALPLRAPTPGDPPRREKRRRALLCSKAVQGPRVKRRQSSRGLNARLHFLFLFVLKNSKLVNSFKNRRKIRKIQTQLFWNL